MDGQRRSRPGDAPPRLTASPEHPPRMRAPPDTIRTPPGVPGRALQPPTSVAGARAGRGGGHDLRAAQAHGLEPAPARGRVHGRAVALDGAPGAAAGRCLAPARPERPIVVRYLW